jgi:cytochrome c biogenesis protein
VRFDGSSAGNQFGAPRDFRAGVDVVPAPGAAATRETIAVNSPLRIGGASVYLAGNGYAPVITVRDSTGQVAFTGQVPFLVQDSEYTSTGVVKVTDVARGQEQLGLQAQFFPTAKVDPVRGVLSTFPDLRNPELIFTAYAGDLGLDGGQPQNAYELDTSRMSQLQGDEGGPFRAALKVGQTVQLPGGRGSVTLDAVARYAGFTVEHDPARVPALVFALLAIAGLTTSLFVPRRRLWVRAVATGGDRTLLEVGVLARSEDPGLSAEADAVLAAVRAELGTALPTAAEQAPDQAAEPTDQQTEQQAEHRTTPRAGSSA